MPDPQDQGPPGQTDATDDDRPRPPLVHLVLLAGAIWVLVIGGDVTFGSWGTFDVRIAMAYLVPALLLHGWGVYSPRGRLGARVSAWLILFAMTIHTQVLLRPAVLAMLGGLALLDTTIAATREPERVQVSVPARITAGVTALLAAGLVGLLAIFAIDIETAVRLSTAVVAGAAVVVAAAMHPPMRAPQRLLPALGLYYLFFVVVAAPELPIGAAIAWWMLCGALFIGAVVAARHVSGTEVPMDKGRHRHVVERLPDPTVARYTRDVEAFLATGTGARNLSERIEHATGRPVTGATLPGLVAAVSKGTHPNRDDRERALRELLEVSH